MNYYDDILNEKNAEKRKKNLDKLIEEKTPTELLVMTAIAVLSEDDLIRKTALERVDERNAEEGDAAGRVVSLIQSWRREGALMTWPEPMNEKQERRAEDIEEAYYAQNPLSSVVKI